MDELVAQIDAQIEKLTDQLTRLRTARLSLADEPVRRARSARATRTVRAASNGSGPARSRSGRRGRRPMAERIEDVMALLQDGDARDTKLIAKRLGISVAYTRTIMAAMAKEGFVEETPGQKRNESSTWRLMGVAA